MAPTKDEQEKFIELRARGYSFDKIAAEIGVSKPTLLKWQDEFKKEIATIEFTESQALLENHRLNRRARIESTASQLEKVIKAIEAKDLSTESLKDLLKMKDGLEESLEKLKTGSIAYTGIIEHTNILKCFDEATEKTLKLD
jgi:transposase